MQDTAMVILLVLFVASILRDRIARKRTAPPRPRARRSRVRDSLRRAALPMAVGILVVATLMFGAAVAPPSDQGRTRDVIYMGWPSGASIDAVRRAYIDQRTPLVVVHQDALAQVRSWAGGSLDVDGLKSGGVDGLTLSAAIEDLSRRDSVLAGQGLVIFAYPKTRDPAADIAALDALLARHDRLRPRLRTAWPSDAIAAPMLSRRLPSVPEPQLRIPAQVSEGPNRIRAEADIVAPPGVTVNVSFRTLRTSDNKLRDHKLNVSTGAVQTTPEGKAVKPTSLNGNSVSLKAELEKPAVNEHLLTVVPVTDSFGHPLATAFGYTAVATPDIGVLVPKGREAAKDSQLFAFLTSLQMPSVTAVELDLDSDSAIEENAHRLAGWGLVGVDVFLTEDQGRRLRDSLAKCRELGETPPDILFVGRGFEVSPKAAYHASGFPPGWQPMHAQVARADGRAILIMADDSGSLTTPVGGKISKTGIEARNELIQELVRLAADGQADVNNIQRFDAGKLLHYLGPDKPGHRGVTRSGTRWELADVHKLVGTTHAIELNPMLVDAVKYCASRPVSDLILFFDPRDMRGQWVYEGYFDELHPDALGAITTLKELGIRLHLIGLRNSVSPGAGFVLDDKLQMLDGSSATSNVDFKDRMVKLIHGVLPRLELAEHEPGLAGFKGSNPSKYERFVTALKDKNLRFINVLAPFRDADKVDGRTLAVAKHWNGEELAPVLTKVETAAWPAQVYWLAVDTQAECGVVKSDVSTTTDPARRRAVAEFVVASLNLIATCLREAPVTFSIDPDARIRVTPRDFQPFWLEGGVTASSTGPSGVEVAAEPDTTDLHALRIKFPGLSIDGPNRVSVEFKDLGRVGYRKFIASLLPPRATLLLDAELRSLFGADIAQSPLKATASLQQNAQERSVIPWAIPASAFRIAIALAVVCIVVWPRL